MAKAKRCEYGAQVTAIRITESIWRGVDGDWSLTVEKSSRRASFESMVPASNQPIKTSLRGETFCHLSLPTWQCVFCTCVLLDEISRTHFLLAKLLRPALPRLCDPTHTELWDGPLAPYPNTPPQYAGQPPSSGRWGRENRKPKKKRMGNRKIQTCMSHVGGE